MQHIQFIKNTSQCDSTLTHSDCGHTMQFFIWFQSPCSGKLIGVDCWGGNMIRFTTDFPLIKPIQYFLCVGKVNVTSRFHQRVDWKSADIRFSINFQTLLSTLDLSVVTQYNFSWKWIGWENQMENQMKNNTVTAS